ncbi:MAG: hypothetical protein RSE07_01230, partial [Oscillospiraceae bacterium]
QGLMGIECFYPKHSKAFTKTCLEIAKRLDLLVTSGSDFHGEDIRPETAMGMEYNTYLLNFFKKLWC